MLLHQRESVEIANMVVERRGSLEVGEDQGDVLDAESLAGCFRAEEVAERLCGQEPPA